jgi:hypothetical protein
MMNLPPRTRRTNVLDEYGELVAQLSWDRSDNAGEIKYTKRGWSLPIQSEALFDATLDVFVEEHKCTLEVIAA